MAKLFRKDDGQKMTQAEKRVAHTERILAVTKTLFIEQGYDKTTMRQIALKSGLLTGSLYNIFPSKEDIFKTFVLNKFNEAITLSKEALSDDEPTLLKLAFPLGISLQLACQDERAAELMHLALSTWEVTSSLLDTVIAWMKEITGQMDVEIPDDVIKSNMVAIFGAVSNFTARIHYEKRTEYRIELVTAIEIFCTLFRIQSDEIEQIADRMSALLEQKHVTLDL